jgi:hypothetical protein
LRGHLVFFCISQDVAEQAQSSSRVPLRDVDNGIEIKVTGEGRTMEAIKHFGAFIPGPSVGFSGPKSGLARADS